MSSFFFLPKRLCQCVPHCSTNYMMSRIPQPTPYAMFKLPKESIHLISSNAGVCHKMWSVGQGKNCKKPFLQIIIVDILSAWLIHNSETP